MKVLVNNDNIICGVYESVNKDGDFKIVAAKQHIAFNDDYNLAMGGTSQECADEVDRLMALFKDYTGDPIQFDFQTKRYTYVSATEITEETI